MIISVLITLWGQKRRGSFRISTGSLTARDRKDTALPSHDREGFQGGAVDKLQGDPSRTRPSVHPSPECGQNP